MSEKIKCDICNKYFSKYGIKNHISIMHNKTKKMPSRKGIKVGTSWNKGKNKLNDDRIKKFSETLKKRYENGDITPTWLNKKHNPETKEKISKTITNKIINKEWHNSFSKSRTHIYKDIKFYGTWELKYAMYLDKNNINWIRVKENFPYYFNGKIRRYTPDFYLVDEQCYIEIKGYKTDKDMAKWAQFPLKLKILDGKILKDMGIIDYYKYTDLSIGDNGIRRNT